MAGLNIANERHNIDKGEHAVFLSGNGPLVIVLQEALARNEVLLKQGTEQQVTKRESLRNTKAFIQNIHHFRDDALKNEKPPIERVAVFDEAQRAWTAKQASAFMARKKGIADFNLSEPEFLIGVLDRHQDWATIICLIGGGQEINTGEAGLPGWFSGLDKHYSHWDVYVSNKLTDKEYMYDKQSAAFLKNPRLNVRNELHLSVSIRSYRTEKLSAFVKAILDIEEVRARLLFEEINDDYPIAVTRDLAKAKKWLRAHARGNESIGIIASSGALRLKPYGIHVKSEINPANWFLNEKDDVRASDFLEDVATEFEIQGLELDWACIAWDANLRKNGQSWAYKNFRGTKWQNVNDPVRQRYLLNSYRVLLTRARQGIIIFLPEGDAYDHTRKPEFYEPTFQYLLQCGIPQI